MTSEKTTGQPNPSFTPRSGGGISQFTRRSMLGLTGLAVAGATVAAWPRLTGTDIPGRGSKALNIAILGTAADAAAQTRGWVAPLSFQTSLSAPPNTC